MLPEGVFRKGEHGYLLDLEVKPGSKTSGFKGYDEWRKRFILNVRSPAQEGRANKEVEKLVKNILGAASVRIVSGKMSHSKTLALELGDAKADEIEKKLLDML